MGVIKELMDKVKEEVGPLASVVKEEMANQVEKVVDRVLGSTPSEDPYAFKATAAPAAEATPAAASPAQAAPAPAPAAPAAADGAPKAPVKITAQPSATDPSACKFTVEVAVSDTRLVRIRTREEAAHSPLAQQLFDIPQVKSITFSGNIVTVYKEGPELWQVIARQVGPAIRSFLASGQPSVLPSYFEQEDGEDGKDDDLALKVQQVIDTMINPGVAGHGGYVQLLGVKSEIAYIRMGGGCQGCGAADLTLKQGIITTIKAHVPDIQDVQDATDHAAGENPFYRENPFG